MSDPKKIKIKCKPRKKSPKCLHYPYEETEPNNPDSGKPKDTKQNKIAKK